MTLKDLDLTTRRKLTRAYPVLISSFPNMGKSSAAEFLSEEDKKRTIIIDVENKGLPNDGDYEYRTVVRIKPEGQVHPTQAHLYVDYDNVKYKTLTELQNYLRKALAHPAVDRVIIDSFTALVDQLEVHFVTVNNGYAVWVNYSKELTNWFSLLKSEARFNGKFIYVLGHYRPAKDSKDTDVEKFTLVKGTMHYKMVESNFNTVLTVGDHKFIADNDNEYDSTRIHKDLSPYESELNSLAELEEALTNPSNPKE